MNSSTSKNTALLWEYSADQLVEMLQTKLDEQASNCNVPVHFNFHQPIVRTRDERRETKNDDASVSEDTSKTP